jgi:hypothetical protein
MRDRRASRRLGLAVVVAISLFACTPTTELPTASASPSPLGTAGPTDVGSDCPGDLPSALVDERLGYRTCMPRAWRDLQPNDPAWDEVLGGKFLEMQRAVGGGLIDHFAVPLDPAADDVDAILVIHSQEVEASETLEVVRDRFVDSHVEIGGELLSSEIVEVGGTRAARVVFDDSNVDAATRDGQLIAFILKIESSAVYFEFTSDIALADEYGPIFDAMAETIEVENAAPAG